MDEENDPNLRFSANYQNIDTAQQRQGDCPIRTAGGRGGRCPDHAKPPISKNMDAISSLTLTEIRAILAT
jgi:hypothetical protein